MLLAIQEHQIDIDKSTTNLSPDLHAKYESIRHDMFRGIESSLVDLKVPYAITKELPKIPGTVVYNEFPGAKPGDITRTGSEFRIGDKVVDISTNPPTKYIESNGVRIESASRYEPPLENLSRQKDCISKLREITGIADFDGNLSTAKQFLDTTNNSLKATSAELIEKETLINTEQKDTPQNTDILEKLRSEISVLKAKQEKITTLITEFNKSMNELVQLQQEEKNSVPQFQEHVKEKDNAIRDNLKYLSSIGLDSLGQSGVDAIVDFIKEKRKGQSGAGEITLQKSFSNTEKKDFSQVVRDIIGTDPFIKDSIPPTLQPAITPQNIRGLMMESGVLSQTGEFNKIRFMEKIQTKQPTEKTP